MNKRFLADILAFYARKIERTEVYAQGNLSEAENLIKADWKNNCIAVRIYDKEFSKNVQAYTKILTLLGDLMKKRRSPFFWLVITGHGSSNGISQQLVQSIHSEIFAKCLPQTHILVSLWSFLKGQLSYWFHEKHLFWNIKFLEVDCEKIDDSQEIYDAVAMVGHPFILQIYSNKKAERSYEYLKYFSESSTTVGLFRIYKCAGIDNVSDIKQFLSAQYMKNEHLPDGIQFMMNYPTHEEVFSEAELSTKQRLYYEYTTGVIKSEDQVNHQIKEHLKNGTSAPFNRSKLIVVGQGQTGKTSTIASLMNRKFVSNVDSTKGFDVKNIQTFNWEESRDAPVVEQLQNIFAQDNLNEKKAGGFKNKSHTSKNLSVSIENQVNDSMKPKSERKHQETTAVLHEFDDSKVQQYTKEFISLGTKPDTFGFSIWDFGGQKVFYTQHHLFLTNYSCYLLVFDMTSILNSKLAATSLSYMRFWLKSIRLHSSSSPVLLVGTHGDKIANQEEHQKVNKILKENLSEDLSFQTVKNKSLSFFPVDNPNNVGVETLRARIEKTVAAEDYIKTLVPVSYLYLLDKLTESDDPYINRVIAKMHIETCGLSEDGFEIALRFLAERGMITYFATPTVMSEIIVLDPQWLVNGISCIIFDPTIHQPPTVTRSLNKVLEYFLSKRILSEELLLDIWNHKGLGEIEQNFFMNLMIETLLMCKYSLVADENLYLIPSLFGTDQVNKKKHISFGGPFFVFDFTGDYNRLTGLKERLHIIKFIPIGLFERIICLAILESVKYKKSAEPIVENEHAIISFGVDVILQFSIVKNVNLEPFQIRIRAQTETNMKHLTKVTTIIGTFVDDLNLRFFSKNKEEAYLDIEMLISSTQDTNYQLASFKYVQELHLSSNDPDEQFFICQNKSMDRASLKSFLHWFE